MPAMASRPTTSRRPRTTLSGLWQVIDNIPARVSYIDRERRHGYANREYAEMVGLPADEIVGKTIGEVFGAEEEGRLRPFGDAALKGETVQWEGWVTFPSDVRRYVQRVYQPMFDRNGDVEGYFVIARDTTDQRAAELERQRLTRLLELALESVPNGFAIYGKDRRIALCNSAYARMQGKSRAELVGKSPEELVQDNLDYIRTYDGQPLDSVADWSKYMIGHFDRADGRPMQVELARDRWILISVYATADGGRVVVRTDISDLKKMENELRRSEARFRSITTANPVPVAVVRLSDGEILYASEPWAELFQLSAEQAIGHSSIGFYANPDDRYRFVAALREKGRVDAFEAVFKKADGTTFPAALTARLFVFEDQDAIVSGIIDLTERHAVEEEMARHREALHQSEKLSALGSLLAAIAHELNNPLSVVLGQSLLLTEKAAGTDLADRAGKIEKAAQRCARIVRTFLDMARSQEPRLQSVQMNDVVVSVLELTGYALHSAGIDVTRRLAPALPEIDADADQIHQVLTNLIVNAQQALLEVPEPRELTVETALDGERNAIVVTVSDNGPGVAGEIRSRIFEPFFSNKPVGAGTGVGLSVSNSIAKAHGGRLELVESQSGAIFRLTIPVGGAKIGVQPPATEVETQAVTGARILIVEDERDVADMLGEMLRRDGYDISLAASGNEALRRIEAEPFDAIISDVRMPDLDGPGLLQALTKAKSPLADRLIFITGDTLSPSARTFLAAAKRPVVEKPLSPDLVRQAIELVVVRDG